MIIVQSTIITLMIIVPSTIITFMIIITNTVISLVTDSLLLITVSKSSYILMITHNIVADTTMIMITTIRAGSRWNAKP